MLACHPERSRGIPWRFQEVPRRDSSTLLRCAQNDSVIYEALCNASRLAAGMAVGGRSVGDRLRIVCAGAAKCSGGRAIAAEASVIGFWNAINEAGVDIGVGVDHCHRFAVVNGDCVTRDDGEVRAANRDVVDEPDLAVRACPVEFQRVVG